MRVRHEHSSWVLRHGYCAMSAMRRVLGIDPGLTATGFGVVDSDGSTSRLVVTGAFRTRPRDERAQRLGVIAERVGALIEEHHPDEMAIEQQYVAQNVRTAMAIGEARAAAMVAAAMRAVPVFQYPPTEIKQCVAGYGAAPKEQVRQMVMVHLGLSEQPESFDASDALAIALTRLAEARMEAILARSASAGRT